MNGTILTMVNRGESMSKKKKGDISGFDIIPGNGHVLFLERKAAKEISRHREKAQIEIKWIGHDVKMIVCK